MGNLTNINNWFKKWLRLLCSFSFNPVKAQILTGLIFCLFVFRGLGFGQAVPLVAYSISSDPQMGGNCTAYGVLEVNKNNGNQWVCPLSTSVWTLITPGTQITFPITKPEGGTGVTNPNLVSGSPEITIIGTWPNQTISFNNPSVLSSDFVFTPQSPGGSLTAGSPQTVTLTPCPVGVAGSDTKHYLYVSGGTGTAEAVLITGGTCTSGAMSGTVIFTPANNHTGAWTIATATVGATEAEYALLSISSVGGTVNLPNGIFSPKAATPYKDNVAWIGQGVGTKLIPPSCTFVFFDANVPVKPSSETTGLVQDNVRFENFLIDGSSCAGVNNLTGINEVNQMSSTEIWSLIGMRVRGVYFNNVHHAAFLERVDIVDFLDDFTYENSILQITDSAFTSTNGDNTSITIKNLNYNWHLLSDDGTQVTMTEAPIVCENCEVFHMEDCKMPFRPIVNTPIVNLVGGEDSQIINNEFETFFNGIQYSQITYTDAGVVYPGYGIIVGNSFDQVWNSTFNIADGTSASVNQHAAHFTIGHNLFTNAVNVLATPLMFNTGNYTTHMSISDNICAQLPDNGEVCYRVGEHASFVNFSGENQITNDEVSGSPSVTGVTIGGTTLGVYGLGTLRFDNFATNINDPRVPVASATTITLPIGLTQVSISGTTQISTITAQPNGTVVTLLFGTGVALTVKTGTGNLSLGSDFVTAGSATSALTLISTGAGWAKQSGAAN